MIKEKYEQIKEKAKETKEKVKNWVDDHPGIVAGACIATQIGVITLAVLGIKKLDTSTKQTELDCQTTIDNAENSYDISPKWDLVFTTEEEHREELNSNFNKMVEFVKTLDMVPGEGYLIDSAWDADDEISVMQTLFLEEGQYETL